jgi:hypothetical protein
MPEAITQTPQHHCYQQCCYDFFHGNLLAGHIEVIPA